jgi:hypothetical protein
MIFDIKMDFTCKAWLVAGGHLTDPLAFITYSSVVTCESAMHISMLLLVKKFTPSLAKSLDTKPTVLPSLLYGLKTSGAAWHAFFAQSLHDLSFTPCCSDPDVWRCPLLRNPLVTIIVNTF